MEQVQYIGDEEELRGCSGLLQRDGDRVLVNLDGSCAGPIETDVCDWADVHALGGAVVPLAAAAAIAAKHSPRPTA